MTKLHNPPDLSGYLPYTGGTMTGAIDFGGYDASNFVIEEVIGLPTPAVAGQMVRLQSDNNLYFGKVT